MGNRASDFVGGQEAVGDALSERIGVDRIAKVLNVGNVFGFFGGCRQSNLGCRCEILEDLSPSCIVRSTAAMALIDNHQIKKVG